MQLTEAHCQAACCLTRTVSAGLSLPGSASLSLPHAGSVSHCHGVSAPAEAARALSASLSTLCRDSDISLSETPRVLLQAFTCIT